MTKRKLRMLDLFCCAGGVSRGFADEGFAVEGIDIEPQPAYQFPFTLGDATKLTPKFLRSYDFVWASPPCQKFTAYRRKDPTTIGNEAKNLIPATRKLLEAAGVPFAIENVVGAPIKHPTTLCGSMFGLDVKRHRLIETSFPMEQPECQHEIWTPRYPCAGNRTNLRSTVEVGVYRIPLATQREAMGISWMPLDRLSQAIPPAYAAYVARQFLATR